MMMNAKWVGWRAENLAAEIKNGKVDFIVPEPLALPVHFFPEATARVETGALQ